MKQDVNDTLRDGGPDAVRERHDRARKFNSGTAVTPDRFQLKAFDAITLSTAPNCLVKGIIPCAALVVVWGPPKCGKSFWTFDLMMHVALGWPYRGRRVQQGPVVYLALEGGYGFAARVVAWRTRHLEDHRDPVPFYLLDVPVDLVVDRDALIQAIQAQLGAHIPAAVVIDTLNRALIGDENKSDDMARFIRAADVIRTAFGCTVVVIHHCGVQGSRPRGHTSLAGADDAQIAVERDDGGIITAKVEFMKDGEAGAVIGSRLEPVLLGTDDDGDPQASCVIVSADVAAASASIGASIRMTANQRRFLDIMNDALIDAPAEHKTKSGIPGGQIAISREWLKMCCKSKGWFDTGASENNNRAKVSNMLNALAGKRLVGLSSLFVWLAK